MRKILLLAAPAGLLLGAFAAGCADPEIVVTREQFGEEWPLEVNSATVQCAHDGEVALLRLGGRRFALNEAARREGFEDPGDVLRAGADVSPLGRVCAAQMATR